MKHSVRFDADNDCARMELVDDFAPEHANALADELVKLLGDRERRVLVIDHVRSPGAVPRATRDVVQRRILDMSLDRIAIYGLTNFNRIAAKIIVAVTGKKDVASFFKTEAEALAWIRELGSP